MFKKLKDLVMKVILCGVDIDAGPLSNGNLSVFRKVDPDRWVVKHTYVVSLLDCSTDCYVFIDKVGLWEVNESLLSLDDKRIPILNKEIKPFKDYIENLKHD